MKNRPSKSLCFPFVFAATLSSVQAQLVVTNGSFEDNGTTENSAPIASWYEAHQIGDNGSFDSAEQALYEGTNSNIPTTDAGTMWGHFIDRSGTPGLIGQEAIYQYVGSWSTGDSTEYLLTALLGDRSNQTFEDLTIEFWSVDSGDLGNAADGTSFSDAFTTESLLASHIASMTDGGAVTATANYSEIFTFDTENLSDGDSVWIRIAQSGSGNGHSLIDNIGVTAVPETSHYALLLGLSMLAPCICGRRRS